MDHLQMNLSLGRRTHNITDLKENDLLAQDHTLSLTRPHSIGHVKQTALREPRDHSHLMSFRRRDQDSVVHQAAMLTAVVSGPHWVLGILVDLLASELHRLTRDGTMSPDRLVHVPYQRTERRVPDTGAIVLLGQEPLNSNSRQNPLARVRIYHHLGREQKRTCDDHTRRCLAPNQ